VEVMLRYLQERAVEQGSSQSTIRGYRSGYLPLQRREIERGLRSGEVRAVVATTALELGIDIGGMGAALLTGYPGTIAATWQRAGRAGRRSGTAAAVLIASSAPLDQFIVQNPDYFFGSSVEHGYIQPDNLEILLNHLKCAAFELPLRCDEAFGRTNLGELCRFLEETGFLHRSGEAYHWASEAYPADAISLRAISSDSFVVVDITGEPRVIGQVDFPSALTTVHEKAIYLHEGRQYHVERFDYKERKAYVKAVDVDYFTDAISYTEVKVLEELERAEAGSGGGEEAAGMPGPAAWRAHGEVQVNTQVVGFKKIKFYTLENVGSGQLTMPEQQMHTTAYWLSLSAEFLEALPYPPSDRQGGITALGNALRAMATLLLMCDRRDLGLAFGNTAGPQYAPNIYLFDNYPGGIGLSAPLFHLHYRLLEQVQKMIEHCPCQSGCPSCVGPAGEVGERGKEVALVILQALRVAV